MTKAELRQYARTLPKAEVDSLTHRFLALPQIQRAQTLLLYYGVKQEPDTVPLIEALWKLGKQVALPVCLPDHRMEARLVTDLGQLVPDRYGIPEPTELCPLVAKQKIDAILVPYVLCDRQGHRLGHGGGYYDRYLADYKGFTLCLCPETHLVEQVPTDAYDVAVELVLTDEIHRSSLEL